MLPVRRPIAFMLATLLALAGCGSGSPAHRSDPADKHASSASADSARQPDADGMVEQTKQGVSLKVPATWKLSKETDSDGLFIWVNPKCKTCGLVALSVDNSTQSAEDFIAMMKGKDGTLRGQVKSQTPVNVEGLGHGYRLHTQYRRNISDRLVVSTMDGLLVMVIATPDADHPEYADLVLGSVARKL